MLKGTNELRLNRATMQEVVEYYLRNNMLSRLGVGEVRVTDIKWLESDKVFDVAFVPAPSEAEKKTS